MVLSLKPKNKASSRRQIQIVGVRDGIMQLPHNHHRAVLEVSSVNFELKSEDEQDALIETYESFLNSVGHPIQILVRTREIDMDKYLNDLRERLSGEVQEIYRDQLKNYDEFIRSLIMTNKILTRHFYVVVPYNAQPRIDFSIIQEHLQLTVDIITKGLSRLGMHSRALSSLEILDLFYSFYSPDKAKIQPLTDQALQLVHTTYITKERINE